MNEEEKGKAGLVAAAAAASLGSAVSGSRVTGFYPDKSKRWPIIVLFLLLCSFVLLENFFCLLLGSFLGFKLQVVFSFVICQTSLILTKFMEKNQQTTMISNKIFFLKLSRGGIFPTW